MKKLSILDIKAKVLNASFGIAAEGELNLFRRLEELLFEGISMGYGLGSPSGRTLADAVAWLEKRRDDFVDQYGAQDPDTGALEFGRGAHADAKTEYMGELNEIIEGLRSLDGGASDVQHGGLVLSIARVIVCGGKITEATMFAPGLPDGEHLLYPVLADTHDTTF